MRSTSSSAPKQKCVQYQKKNHFSSTPSSFFVSIKCVFSFQFSVFFSCCIHGPVTDLKVSVDCAILMAKEITRQIRPLEERRKTKEGMEGGDPSARREGCILRVGYKPSSSFEEESVFFLLLLPSSLMICYVCALIVTAQLLDLLEGGKGGVFESSCLFLFIANDAKHKDKQILLVQTNSDVASGRTLNSIFDRMNHRIAQGLPAIFHHSSVNKLDETSMDLPRLRTRCVGHDPQRPVLFPLPSCQPSRTYR